MHNVHIALQELQAVVLLLHKMAFYLSGKVVTLHLHNSIAKANLYNKNGTVFVFLSRPACYILNLGEKHGITNFSKHTYPS